MAGHRRRRIPQRHQIKTRNETRACAPAAARGSVPDPHPARVRVAMQRVWCGPLHAHRHGLCSSTPIFLTLSVLGVEFSDSGGIYVCGIFPKARRS